MLSLSVVLLLWVTSAGTQAPTIKILGVPKPLTLTATELAALPRTKVTASAHKSDWRV
jgi:hypothetical protein